MTLTTLPPPQTAHGAGSTTDPAPGADGVFEIETVRLGPQTVRAGRSRARASGHPPLLVFNGIGANIELLAPLAAAMPEREIITFDVPGVGGSPLPVTPYRMFMIAWLGKRLLRHYGHTQGDVIGISWGGAAAQQFAVTESRHLRRLVLCATATGALMVPAAPKVLRKMATPRRYYDPDYGRAIAGELYGGDCRQGDAALGEHFQHVRFSSRLGYLLQLTAASGWTSLPWLPLIRRPTLIMAGTDDPLIPQQNAKLMHKLIRGSELQWFDCGHLFLLTRLQPSVDALHTFLDRD